MKIEINNHRKIFAIQEEFYKIFPGLKIEFHEKSGKAGGSPSTKLVKSSSKTLAECRTMHNSGFISIKPGMTAGEVIQNFSDVYGLSVEIFRSSENNTQLQSPVSEKTILGEVNNEVELPTPS
jgi:hypothetical protein